MDTDFRYCKSQDIVCAVLPNTAHDSRGTQPTLLNTRVQRKNIVSAQLAEDLHAYAIYPKSNYSVQSLQDIGVTAFIHHIIGVYSGLVSRAA